jgi:hypothetical protein
MARTLIGYVAGGLLEAAHLAEVLLLSGRAATGLAEL